LNQGASTISVSAMASDVSGQKQKTHGSKKTIIRAGQKVNFIEQGSSFIPVFEQITSVIVAPFTSDGLLVCALLPRGIDLPGGHIQVNENSCEETARREALEETGVTLSDLQVVQVIESDYYGNELEELTYIVVMAGLVKEILPYDGLHESLGRRIIDIDTFIAEYQAGDKDMMRRIVSDGMRLVFE
jgi:8-oxo-dGTP pyrophosphatase MutT (NUDIX family)